MGITMPKKRNVSKRDGEMKRKTEERTKGSLLSPVITDMLSTQPIDELDMKLLTILQENGRMSNIDIAEKMQMSEATIRRRINSLIERDLIRGFSALLNHKKLGHGLKASIYVKVKKDDLDEVVKMLNDCGRACNIHQVMGKYNIHSELLFQSILELQEFIDDLSLSDHVEDMEYHIVTKSYKVCPWTGI
jgi:Lrp/AsnC family transcriptional regulator for asnA, asnC and gidA